MILTSNKAFGECGEVFGGDPVMASAALDRRSTVITSQLPVDQWHLFLGDPTLADAILDRIVHNAYRVTLTGDSMRKQKAAAAQSNPMPKAKRR